MRRQVTGLLAMAALVLLAGCATTGSDMVGVGGGPDDVAGSVFDHPRADRRGAPRGFGYQLTGQSGWSGDLVYEDDSGGAIRVALLLADADGAEQAADLQIAMPYLEGGVRRFHGTAASGEPAELQLQAGPCEVADETGFTHFAALRIGETVQAGCAREQAQDDRWSNYIMSYLPAIDACLAEFGDRPAHVSLAYTMSGGATGVRIVDADTQTWECATRDEGRAVNSLRPLDSADALFGEGDPIFVRGVFPDFGEGCYVYESVREADGTLIGALGYDACNAVPVTTAQAAAAG